MYSIYIDPSFKGTGVFVVDAERRHGYFHLIGAKGVKKSLERYFHAVLEIGRQFISEVLDTYNDISEVYMEAPLIGLWASEGLHMLQFYLLYCFRQQVLHCNFPSYVNSISVSYIKGAVNRECRKRGIDIKASKISLRQALMKVIINEMVEDGWTFSNLELCFISGSDDAATAFLFWYLTLPGKDMPKYSKLFLIAL